MGSGPRGRSARGAHGFTLVEALTGIAVLLVVLLTLIGVVPAVFGFSAQNAVHVQAVAAGQDYLDIIRQYIKAYGVDTNLPAAPTVPIDPGYGYMSNQALASSGNFNLSPNCTALSLYDFDCVVSVNWTENGVPHSVNVESYIASQAGL